MDRRRSGRNFRNPGIGDRRSADRARPGSRPRVGRVRRWRRSARRCRTSSWAGTVPGRSPACRAAGGTLRRGRRGARILRRAGTVRTGRRPRARGSRGTRRIPGGYSEDGSRLRRPSSAGWERIGTSAPRGGSGAGEKLREEWLDSTTTRKRGVEDETRLGRSPPCLSPLNYPDFSLPMGRTPGRDGETRGEVSRRARAGGARRILVAKSAGFGFSSFFAGRNSPRDARVRERRGSDEPGFARAVTTRRRYPHLVDH